MRVVQGTIVKVRIRTANPDNGAPYDPPDVTVLAKPPTHAMITLSLSGGQIIRTPALTGLSPPAQTVGDFTAFINTSTEAGGWEYEIATSGVNARLVRRSFTVDPFLA